ncbi:YceI family protein [Elizabethkingia anophelis]|uniref:Lipid/polyisoprenoid-binding YceI-like domain-containing protein n=1 Tax=Elizabethkingia anophelis TaxID=1117645 RepID=A0AAU8UW55_9FLAO|nr:YceI family protein [Elizabethkingia anophelis]AQX02200.1 hypothetical protein BBD32_12345 [Elizabethkingia anophelis]OPB58902.1 hypothetical protein BAY11_17930 [Elizabethkingia anophelis]
MKKIFLIMMLCIVGVVSAQNYKTTSGKTSFSASVPLFEDINAKDATTVVIVNADTGDMASVSVTKNYHFKVKLMEEHFNENYAESKKYPKVTFKGKILNFDKSKVSSVPQKYNVQGVLNFHGVSKSISTLATIFVKDSKFYMKGSFVVRTADFNVKIPKVVSKKIAENVKVEYDYIMQVNK